MTGHTESAASLPAKDDVEVVPGEAGAGIAAALASMASSALPQFGATFHWTGLQCSACIQHSLPLPLINWPSIHLVGRRITFTLSPPLCPFHCSNRINHRGDQGICEPAHFRRVQATIELDCHLRPMSSCPSAETTRSHSGHGNFRFRIFEAPRRAFLSRPSPTCVVILSATGDY